MAESGKPAVGQFTAFQPIQADYLIIGTGAVGMAFADTLLNETRATIALVDRRHRPGGHWNDAYPYVRLHQPSAYYGVNSWPLGSGEKDESGLNKGFYELASGPRGAEPLRTGLAAAIPAIRPRPIFSDERGRAGLIGKFPCVRRTAPG